MHLPGPVQDATPPDVSVGREEILVRWTLLEDNLIIILIIIINLIIIIDYMYNHTVDQEFFLV